MPKSSSFDFLEKTDLTLSHTVVTVSSLIKCDVFWDKKQTSPFTIKLELRNNVLLRVNGNTIRESRPKKSWFKIPPPPSDLGKNDQIVDITAEGELKRECIAAP